MRPMHLLILGGSIFLGRHLVASALERGHTVTLFNRGRHNPDLFPDIEKLRGDRTNPEDLLAVERRTFDAVIDTCGYVPRIVRLSAERLAGSAGLYCFISSVSVYADFRERRRDESAPVGTLSDPTGEEVTGETYGPLKALCEQAVEETFPAGALNIRPGLIVGPDDPSDRFTYWPHRIAEGGEVLAPGTPQQTTQFIDVRDLAAWTIGQVERGATGAYNATGPADPIPYGTLFDICRGVSGSDARLTWVDEAFLLEEGVQPWSELPLWVPSTDADMAGFNAIGIAKAVADGLTFRPLADTVRDTLAWDGSRSQEGAWKNTLSPERERALLAKWHAR